MTTRATITLPSDVYQLLVQEAERNNKSFSEFIRDIVQKEVERRHQEEQQRNYEIMRKLSGSINDPTLTNIAENIDEILYGEYGAWRGQINDDEL